MIVCKNRNKTRNLNTLVCMIIALPVVLNILNTILSSLFGIKNTSSITLLLYFFLLCLFAYRVLQYRILTVQKFLLYSSVIIIFLLNYLLFPKSREYFLSDSMLLVYVFFLPVAVVLFPEISDWNEVFKQLNVFSLVAISLSLIIVLSGLTQSLNYMEFSYSLLFFVGIAIYNYSNNLSIINLIFIILGILTILIFGARATVFFAVACLLVFFFEKRKTKALVLVALCVICGVIIILMDDVITSYLTELYHKTDSYFLRNLLHGNLFKSEGRDYINEKCVEALNTMGLSVFGLFGDREIVYPEAYSHNFFYEVLLSFGWLFGLTILIVFFYFVCSLFFKSNPEYKKILIIVFLCYFARYFISGSFIQEYQFYYFCGIIFSLRRSVIKSVVRDTKTKKTT